MHIQSIVLVVSERENICPLPHHESASALRQQVVVQRARLQIQSQLGSRVNQGLYCASSFLNKSLLTSCWVGELGSSCTSSSRLSFSAPACTMCLLSWYLNCMLWSTCCPRLPRPESELSQWIDLPEWAGVQESWAQATTTMNGVRGASTHGRVCSGIGQTASRQEHVSQGNCF